MNGVIAVLLYYNKRREYYSSLFTITIVRKHKNSTEKN